MRYSTKSDEPGFFTEIIHDKVNKYIAAMSMERYNHSSKTQKKKSKTKA